MPSARRGVKAPKDERSELGLDAPRTDATIAGDGMGRLLVVVVGAEPDPAPGLRLAFHEQADGAEDRPEASVGLPLQLFEAKVVEAGLAEADDLRHLDAEVAQELAAAVAAAEEAPLPTAEDVLTDVYVEA